ncbi:MAG: IS3 family transposase [Streptosporangiales bacterium]
MVNTKDKKLSQRKQCNLLSVNRSGLYYKPLGESKLNLKLMKKIDKIHLEEPAFGVLRMQDELEEEGYVVNHKRVRRLMRKMQINAIYPKPNLSKLGKTKYIYPYLLRNLNINRPNQVWEIDISYIPMRKGFMYLTAVIDVYSRYILGWQLSNSLEKENQTTLIEDLFERYGTPEILNSDQGSQYTSNNWIECLKEYNVKISMDGRGRATDNIYIERFWRSIKYDYIYLNPAESGLELYEGIDIFVEKYNRRKHQGVERKKPINLYNCQTKNKLKSA